MTSVANLFADTPEAAEISQQVEKNLFDCLRLRNGVYKTTYAHRMDDLNAWVANYLPLAQELQLLDVAISSGTSTFEWVQALEQANLKFHMTGNDLTISGFLVSFGERLHVVLDQSKWPLLFEINGQWLSNPPRKRQLLRFGFPLAFVKALLLIWDHSRRASEQRSVQRILGLRTTTRPISLLTSRLVNHPRVSIREGNLLNDSWLEGQFHVIRAANILNRKYFDEKTLRQIVANLCRHLATNGMLIVCRTDTDENARNHATIFRLGEEEKIELVARMNGGAEIEDLILEVGNPQLAAPRPIVMRAEEVSSS